MVHEVSWIEWPQAQRQRRFVLQPSEAAEGSREAGGWARKLARSAYPGNRSKTTSTPTGLRPCAAMTQPRWGLRPFFLRSQGSSCLATLGCETQRRWRSAPHLITPGRIWELGNTFAAGENPNSHSKFMKQNPIIVLGIALSFTQLAFQSKAADSSAATQQILPGNGLAQHDFLYAGESKGNRA